MSMEEDRRHMTEFAMSRFKEAIRKVMVHHELIRRKFEPESKPNEREELGEMLDEWDEDIKEMKEELKDWQTELGK